MFRKDLKNRMQKIFGLGKTTFLDPTELFEQDTLFIQISQARGRMSRGGGGRETARVVGSIVIYSQNNKLPFGFFNKRIEQADPELTKNLFFYDLDTDDPESPARRQNIHERRCGFMFLYDSQYDPNQGQITSLAEG